MCLVGYFTMTVFPTVALLIVSITKSLIPIGSPRAFLTHNRCVITWVNYARRNGFFLNIYYSF